MLYTTWSWKICHLHICRRVKKRHCSHWILKHRLTNSVNVAEYICSTTRSWSPGPLVYALVGRITCPWSWGTACKPLLKCHLHLWKLGRCWITFPDWALCASQHMNTAKLQYKSCKCKYLLIGFAICIWLACKMIKYSPCLVPQSICTRTAGEQLRCVSRKDGRIYPLKSVCHDIPKSKLLIKCLFHIAKCTLDELCNMLPMHLFTHCLALKQFAGKAKYFIYNATEQQSYKTN